MKRDEVVRILTANEWSVEINDEHLIQGVFVGLEDEEICLNVIWDGSSSDRCRGASVYDVDTDTEVQFDVDELAAWTTKKAMEELQAMDAD
jgi:hypothetical protein